MSVNVRSAKHPLLSSLTCSGELVFPAAREAKRDEKSIAYKDANRVVIMSGFKKFFKKIATLGNLPRDATPHTLRHSFTSLAGRCHGWPPIDPPQESKESEHACNRCWTDRTPHQAAARAPLRCVSDP